MALTIWSGSHRRSHPKPREPVQISARRTSAAAKKGAENFVAALQLGRCPSAAPARRALSRQNSGSARAEPSACCGAPIHRELRMAAPGGCCRRRYRGAPAPLSFGAPVGGATARGERCDSWRTGRMLLASMPRRSISTLFVVGARRSTQQDAGMPLASPAAFTLWYCRRSCSQTRCRVCASCGCAYVPGRT
jgi:hypothetical protein